MMIWLWPMTVWLGGCMMSGVGGMGMGSGGMHGTMGGMADRGPTFVKESVTSGVRMTVEFPPYRLGDSLRYVLVVQEAENKAPLPGAVVGLFVSPSNGGASAERDHAAAHAGPDSTRAATPTVPVTELEYAASDLGNGCYAFRPSITAAGAYRLRFVITGGLTPDPAVSHELEHVVQIPSSGNGHGRGMAAAGADDVRSISLLLLGAGAMAVAMLFMVR